MLGVRQVIKFLPTWVKTAIQARVQYRRYCSRYALAIERRHPLAGELIISLTSYPPRFATLAFTLKSLLRQNVKADRVILWIAQEDMAELPKAVKRLSKYGVELRAVPNVRSYKKLVYALHQYSRAYIAIGDDDVFYPPDWLSDLVMSHDGSSGLITCHRAHRIRHARDGKLAPYRDWEWEADDAPARRPSADLVPTGVGGVLYPPGCFTADVVNKELYTSLAPNADDLWFYWCARRAGSLYRKVGGRFPLLYFAASQNAALWNINETGNDLPIARLTAAYGDPTRMPSR